MFTEEEKIRAIELYFKYGKKLAPVVRELGYPSKRNLRRWIRLFIDQFLRQRNDMIYLFRRQAAVLCPLNLPVFIQHQNG